MSISKMVYPPSSCRSTLRASVHYPQFSCCVSYVIVFQKTPSQLPKSFWRQTTCRSRILTKLSALSKRIRLASTLGRVVKNSSIHIQVSFVGFLSQFQPQENFPGASRYRSSTGSTTTSAPASSYMDPYTGASRYSGASQPAAPTAPASTYMDPFTGASRYSGAPPTPAPTVTTNTLPVVRSLDPSGSLADLITQATFIPFKQANVAAMQAKFYQFDEVLRNEIVSCLQMLKFILC